MSGVRTTTTGTTGTSMPTGMNPAHPQPVHVRSRDTTETTSAFKTTELLAYLATVAAIAVAAFLIDGGEGQDDYFRADKALMYITFATIGYLVSRGLAKAGSYDRD